MIEYRLRSARESDVLGHLIECQDSFIPPLSQSVDIKEYAVKVVNHSVTVEAWDDKKLIGLIAVYLNDPLKKFGFITNVSVLSAYKGQGIASKLLESCVELAKRESFEGIKLEVAILNDLAIKLYVKFGFKIVFSDNKKHTMQLAF